MKHRVFVDIDNTERICEVLWDPEEEVTSNLRLRGEWDC